MLPFLTALAPFAPIIGGAIGAIGSLMAPKPKPTTQTNSIDLKRLRADAEAAGFNPLAIIRGGGLAGYGTSTMSAAPDTRLAGAFQTFGSGFAQWQYDPYAERKSLAELALAKAQVASFARTGAPAGLSFQTPSSRGVHANSPDLQFAGFPWATDDKTSPAQMIQDRYGDLVEWIYGLGVLGVDTAKNAGVKTDKMVKDLSSAPMSFLRHLDARNARIQAERSERVGLNGVKYQTGGGF